MASKVPANSIFVLYLQNGCTIIYLHTKFESMKMSGTNPPRTVFIFYRYLCLQFVCRHGSYVDSKTACRYKQEVNL